MAKQPPIKKLSKEELEEGLTLEFVNSIRMDRFYSPVQLQKGDDPAHLLECSAGFWVMVDGKALADEKNQLIVWKMRECQIGRARYLLNYGKQEKEHKIQQLIGSWTAQVQEKMTELKKTMRTLELEGWPEKATGFESAIIELYYKDFEADHKAQHIQGRQELYTRCADLYTQCENMLANKQIVELMEFMGIRKFPALMLSVKLDNPQQIKTLVNTFSAAELERWANMEYDRTYKYAQIEIEKQYTI